jgi:homoserine kinase type II
MILVQPQPQSPPQPHPCEPELSVRPPVRALAGHWPLLDGTALRGLPASRSRHWRIPTPAGVFVLRHTRAVEEPSALAARLRLGALLHRRGLPWPRTVPGAGGREFAVVDGRMWTLTEAVAGTGFDDGSPAHLHAIARTLAEYHRAVADAPVAYAEPDVVQQLQGGTYQLPGDRFWQAQVAEVVVALRQLSPLLPRLVMHGGAGPDSFVFHGDAVACLRDADSARPGPRVQDLPVVLEDLRVPRSGSDRAYRAPLDVFRAAGYLRAYGAVSPLTAAEQRALPLLMRARLLVEVLDVADRSRGESAAAAVRDARDRVRWLVGHHLDLARVARVCARG